MENHAQAARRLQTWQNWMERVTTVNRELWLLLSIFAIGALLNWLVASMEWCWACILCRLCSQLTSTVDATPY